MRILSLFTLMALFGCSSTKVVVPKANEPEILKKLEVGEVKDRSLKVAPLMTSTDSTAVPIATVRVKNHTNLARINWYTATLPLPEGSVTELDIPKLSTHHGAISAVPIKWHFKDGSKHSVAIAKVKFPAIVQPGEELEVPFFVDQKPNPLPFSFGPNLSAMLATPVSDLMFLEIKLKNDPKKYYATMWQNPAIIEASTQSYTFRWNGNAKASNETLGLTFTTYLTFDNRLDFGQAVVSVGHNDFDILKSGGYDIDYVDLFYKKPFELKIKELGSYGATQRPDNSGFGVIRLVSNQIIADGSARTFRGLWKVIPNQNDPQDQWFNAEYEDPSFGVSLADDWRQSYAGGIVGAVSPLRGTLAQVRQSVQGDCNANYDVRITAYPKMANKTPSATGDQPAFSSNMPEPQQKAIVTSSSCLIEYMMLGAQVEEYRQSYWWKNGRRINWLDTGAQCYFWSGRPHWHTSHLGPCPEWATRSTGNGFVIGENYGWAAEDDQHWGNPLLKGYYEMSGDPWAKDVLEYRMSLALWNRFGDYAWHITRIGSERAVRVGYNATELLRYNPDSPIAAELKPRLARHMDLRLSTIDNYMSSWGVYGLEAIYGDGRHPVFLGTTPGATCVNGAVCEENRGVISWWSGFSMTFAYQLIKYGIAPDKGQEFINKYMDMMFFYWDEAGDNAGGRRLNNWNVKEDPFANTWHSGWLSAVERFGRNHPNYTWFINNVSTKRNSWFNPSSGYFSFNDKWFQ